MAQYPAMILEWQKAAFDIDTVKFQIHMSDNRTLDNTVSSTYVLEPGDSAPHIENFPYVTTHTHITVVVPVTNTPCWFKIIPINGSNDLGIAGTPDTNVTATANMPPFKPRPIRAHVTIDKTTNEVTVSWLPPPE